VTVTPAINVDASGIGILSESGVSIGRKLLRLDDLGSEGGARRFGEGIVDGAFGAFVDG
jgi:hypothetical protein